MAVTNTTLDDISGVIGFSATLKIAAWFGDSGQNLYVPATPTEDSVLVKLIGENAAKRLADEWGGEFLAVPALTPYEIDSRKRFIAQMLDKGFGTRAISYNLRMSERRVQQICRELELQGLIAPVGPVEKSDDKKRSKVWD